MSRACVLVNRGSRLEGIKGITSQHDQEKGNEGKGSELDERSQRKGENWQQIVGRVSKAPLLSVQAKKYTQQDQRDHEYIIMPAQATLLQHKRIPRVKQRSKCYGAG